MAPHWVTTVAEARAAVREEAAKKVDLIKIWVDDRMGMVKKLTPELYTAVIDEAHKNRPAGHRAHLHARGPRRASLRAGVDALAHGVRDKDIDDEFMAIVKQHPNLVLGPNMPERGVPTDLTWLRESIPPPTGRSSRRPTRTRPRRNAFWSIQARNLAKMNAAGVKIVVGTDGNTPYAPHIEMEDMVAAGMTPMQVITAATRNGAQFLRLTDVGTIEANKSADFVVLDANPLDNITNTAEDLVRLSAARPQVDRAPFR